MSSYFEQKSKHAYTCYKKGIPRKKVYAVVEKGDKFVVLKSRAGDIYKFSLSGGGIEKGEDSITAIKREILEELNIEAEFVRRLGKIAEKSKWNYKGKEFWVDDDIEIVYTKFIKFGNNNQFGIDGEFATQDVVVEVTKEEMFANVYEFVKAGIKL